MRFTPAIFLYFTNRNSDGRSGVSLSFNPAPINRGKLSTKLGSLVVPLSFSRNSDPRSGDARVPQESHQRAVCTLWGARKCKFVVWCRVRGRNQNKQIQKQNQETYIRNKKNSSYTVTGQFPDFYPLTEFFVSFSEFIGQFFQLDRQLYIR
jgi:hypothetical protein